MQMKGRQSNVDQNEGINRGKIYGAMYIYDRKEHAKK